MNRAARKVARNDTPRRSLESRETHIRVSFNSDGTRTVYELPGRDERAEAEHEAFLETLTDDLTY